jgi:hypothetical protein
MRYGFLTSGEPRVSILERKTTSAMDVVKLTPGLKDRFCRFSIQSISGGFGAHATSATCVKAVETSGRLRL